MGPRGGPNVRTWSRSKVPLLPCASAYVTASCELRGVEPRPRAAELPAPGWQEIAGSEASASAASREHGGQGAHALILSHSETRLTGLTGNSNDTCRLRSQQSAHILSSPSCHPATVFLGFSCLPPISFSYDPPRLVASPGSGAAPRRPDPASLPRVSVSRPAGVQSAFVGRVAGVRFGASSGEVWVSVPNGTIDSTGSRIGQWHMCASTARRGERNRDLILSRDACSCRRSAASRQPPRCRAQRRRDDPRSPTSAPLLRHHGRLRGSCMEKRCARRLHGGRRRRGRAGRTDGRRVAVVPLPANDALAVVDAESRSAHPHRGSASSRSRRDHPRRAHRIRQHSRRPAPDAGPTLGAAVLRPARRGRSCGCARNRGGRVGEPRGHRQRRRDGGHPRGAAPDVARTRCRTQHAVRGQRQLRLGGGDRHAEQQGHRVHRRCAVSRAPERARTHGTRAHARRRAPLRCPGRRERGGGVRRQPRCGGRNAPGAHPGGLVSHEPRCQWRRPVSRDRRPAGRGLGQRHIGWFTRPLRTRRPRLGERTPHTRTRRHRCLHRRRSS